MVFFFFSSFYFFLRFKSEINPIDGTDMVHMNETIVLGFKVLCGLLFGSENLILRPEMPTLHLITDLYVRMYHIYGRPLISIYDFIDAMTMQICLFLYH